MGRTPLLLGTSGTVTVDEMANGKWRARCTYRDANGKTQPLERWGTTRAKAKNRLEAEVKTRSTRGTGRNALSAESTVAQLMDAWFSHKLLTADPPLAVGTRARYRDIIDRLISPVFGKLHLWECSTGQMDQALVALRTSKAGITQGELARTILNQAFSYAATWDAVVGNPITAVTKPKVPIKEPRSLTQDELVALREALRGMRQNTWLRDIFEVQLVIAGRIGEVLALTAADIDIEDPKCPRLFIAATVVTPAGLKFHRQLHIKKGPGGAREVILPDWILPTIRQRSEYSVDNPDGLLFATRNHTLLSPHNVRESWRNVRDAAGLGWVSPHNLRKTALSEIDAVFGIEAASSFADHTSVAVTERHYVAKKVAPAFDARVALDRLAPRPVLRLVEDDQAAS
jgi:integrase